MTVLLSERSVRTGIRVVAKRHGEASRRTSRAPVVDVIANHLRSVFKPRLIEQVGLLLGFMTFLMRKVGPISLAIRSATCGRRDFVCSERRMCIWIS